jgi:MFS family permease
LITLTWRLSAAGFAATAISFGPARMGFGLFAPEFRDVFSLSSADIGWISSLGFLGFFLGLLIAPVLVARRGAGFSVICGLFTACTGMGAVAAAPSVWVLSPGVFLAATSAGMAWSPFNTVMHVIAAESERTGTGVGIAIAGLALFGVVSAGLSWRACWALFAVLSALALIGNRFAFHELETGSDREAEDIPSGRPARMSLLPLGIGVVFGASSAIFIAFAADHAVQSGGLGGLPLAATPAVIYVCYGLVGLLGLLTGRARSVFGLTWLIRLILVSGSLSLGVMASAPNSWTGLLLASGLQGLYVMTMSAVLAFWSEQLFPASPSRGFTKVLLAVAAGSVAGPVLFGMIAEADGAENMLIAAACLPALAAMGTRSHHVAICRPPKDPEISRPFVAAMLWFGSPRLFGTNPPRRAIPASP